jgi:predicted aspartyl protease
VFLLLAGCATAQEAHQSRVVLAGPTDVTIQVYQGITLVSASINRAPGALMMVDTGAQWTLVSPLLARRVGLAVPADAPKRKLTVVGGQMIDVPFVRLATLRVGEAVVEDFEVGVYEIFPQTKVLDGLLGGDFLHKFRVTVDRTANRMRLEPLGP